MRASVFLFAIHFAAAPLISQSLGSVEGKVVNAVTGEAVKKAVVTIRNRTGQYTYFTSTDLSGKFHFDNVQPEKYIVSADAEGFAGSGRSSASWKLFAVAAAQQVAGVEIPIPPLSVISGKVIDDNGEPLDSVNVMALRYTYNNGTKMLQSAGNAQTDDRGQYRIFDLQPGRYYLSASTPNRSIRPLVAQGAERIHSTVPEEAYAVVVYPGVADVSQASPHELKPGEQWTGADFKLHKLPAFHIRGRINGPEGQLGGRGIIRAESCNPDPMPARNFLQPMMGRADGVFDVAGAVPGTYCLSVMGPGRGAVVARQTVTVKDADLNDITLTPEASFSIKGTITIDGTPPASMSGIGLGLRSSPDNQQMGAAVAGDLSFNIDFIVPGTYTIMLHSPPLLYVKSMLFGGQDVSNGVIQNAQPGASLAIVMGTDPGEIDGTVQLGSLESGTPVMLVALPDDAHATRFDLMRVTSSSAEGTFTMQGLAPGDYKVFALQQQDYEDTQNRDLLKLLEGKAAVVTVHAAGHEQVSVTPVSASELAKAKEKIP